MRGKRAQLALPDRAPFNADAVLFNARVFASAREYLDLWLADPARDVSTKSPLAATDPLTVEFFSLMHNMAGSDFQDFHNDSRHFDDVRVQVPLIDVGEDTGPLEVEPLSGGEACGGTVRVHSRKGAANLYTGRTVHRGTANTGPRDRTALDWAYMSPAQAQASAYMKHYRMHAREAQARHNGRFAALCNSAGGRCATFDVMDQGEEIDDTVMEAVAWYGTFGATCLIGYHVLTKLGL